MQLPNQYGPYLLLERISVGGMAEVFKAKEYGVEGFERTVAVKRILPHVAEDDEFIAMFKDEAKIAVQLNHGNIAQIYNLGNEQDSFYIALEYINGRDVRAVFQKCQQQNRPMPVAQACYVIMKICEGLDYAHNKKDKYQRELNIVHRDVSPPNILVSFEGEVKLIDFGVAKAAGRASRTQAGILKGKFGYMSPEQVRGMPLDRRSDVFSVGVVLFEILTSHRLFQAETDFATLEKVRAVEVPRPSSLNPEIPKPLENIVYKALAREPEQRYQSAIELHDELQAFMFAQGLFYSRKDLAAWMRQQYAREIELEKEKDKAQANIRPETLQRRGGQQGQPQQRQRKTMMMPTGGGPPPPPPGGAAPRRSQPPPPPGRGAPPRASLRGPTAQHQSVQIGSSGPPPPKGKRKTMVMTTQRPGNLPPPPGGGGRRPRSAARDDGNEAPTVPLGDAAPRRPRANPKPKGGKPAPTMSYAAGAAGAPPAGDFDWDDEELETRLFEGDSDAARDEEPPTQVPRPGNPLGAMPSPPGRGAPMRPTPAPMRTSGPGGGGPAASITVIPPASDRGMGAPPPGPAVRTSFPPGVPNMAAPPGRTAVPLAAHPQPIAPPPPNPFPSAPMGGMQPGPMPPHMMGGHGPPMGPGPQMGMGGPGMGRAPMPPTGLDYDERPANKSSAGPIIAILVAVIVLMVASFFGWYFLVFQKKGGVVGPSQASAESSEAAEPGAAPATAQGSLTVQTTPSDSVTTVDGNPVSGESPFVVPGLSAGTHRVTVVKPGYLPFEKDVTVAQGGATIVANLAHQKVNLILETDPAGAAVNILEDGVATPAAKGGETYPLERKPGKRYEVEALLRGYKPTRQSLDFTGEQNQRVRITLPPDPMLAAGGSATPPAPQADPEPAPEPASTSKPRKKKRSTPRKPSKPRSDPSPSPSKTQAATSTLRIGTNPGVPPAEVFVDGKRAGKTPIPGHKVTPGRHQVKFKWPGGKEIKKSVTVEDGGAQVVKAG